MSHILWIDQLYVSDYQMQGYLFPPFFPSKQCENHSEVWAPREKQRRIREEEHKTGETKVITIPVSKIERQKAHRDALEIHGDLYRPEQIKHGDIAWR